MLQKSENMSQNKKICVILSESLPIDVALNTIAHLMASFGYYAKNIIGQDIKDKSGNLHKGIPVYPNVILKAKEKQIKGILETARKEEVFYIDYPEEGHTTYTDAEFTEKVSQHTEDTIKYIAIVLFGDKEKVSELTKKLSLWK